MFWKKQKLTNEQLLDKYRDCLTEKELLKLELQQAKLALDAAYSILENVTELKLIDSAIYELNSIQMRYTFYTKKLLNSQFNFIFLQKEKQPRQAVYFFSFLLILIYFHQIHDKTQSFFELLYYK